jgi:predicted ATPase
LKLEHLHLRNWKNFRSVDVPLSHRVFVVGPNAAGKSNLLDAIRFLRDVAENATGFQRAVSKERGGVTRVRSLHARKDPNVQVGVGVELDGERWWYELHFHQDPQRRPRVRSEIVKRGDTVLLERPGPNGSPDRQDPELLTQTHLEQVSSNQKFRALADALAEIRYQHIVPQLVREPQRSSGRTRDPYGGDFLEQLARWEKENRKVYNARMRRVRDALRVALPQLEKLELKKDHLGVPHLLGRFAHWRPGAGWQAEDQFSDGSLRLLGLLWAVLDGSAPLLLEEPELSLHPALVRLLPAVIAKASADSERQVILSTHSPELLSDPGIAPEEVLLLEPSREGTSVRRASDRTEVAALVAAGWPVGDAVLPAVAPQRIEQLLLDMGS